MDLELNHSLSLSPVNGFSVHLWPAGGYQKMLTDQRCHLLFIPCTLGGTSSVRLSGTLSATDYFLRLPDLTQLTFSSSDTKHGVEHHIATTGPPAYAWARCLDLDKLMGAYLCSPNPDPNPFPGLFIDRQQWGTQDPCSKKGSCVSHPHTKRGT